METPMVHSVLVLMMVLIFVTAVYEIRRDPSMTRRRILQSLGAVGFLLVFTGTGISALYLLLAAYGKRQLTDGEAAVMAGGLLVWITLGFVVLFRFPGVRKPGE
jgi:hypothetical protein